MHALEFIVLDTIAVRSGETGLADSMMSFLIVFYGQGQGRQGQIHEQSQCLPILYILMKSNINY